MIPSTSLTASLIALVHVLACYADELKIEVMNKPENCERKTKKFDLLKVHYKGTIASDGTQFDSSHERNEPSGFQLGVGQVIKGWDEGVLDMCVGEKRKIYVPADLAYGKEGAGDKIPPDTALNFEIELVDIKDGEAPPNVFKLIDVNNDKELTEEEILNYIKTNMKDSPDDDGEHKKMVAQIFNHEDKNRDGVITHEEFSGPKHDEL